MSASLSHDTAHLAETYDRLSDFQFEGGKRLAEHLDLKPGDAVLDVGCGTGRLARWVADRIGPTGRVAGIDPLPERIAIARSRGEGITFEVGRAEDLSAFADETFDAVLLSAVLHWVADKPKALAEVRRVLRPGGRVGATTMARELHWVSSVAGICAGLLRQPPYAAGADLSALDALNLGSTSTEMIGLIVGSGLKLIELGVRTRTRVLASGDEVVSFLESSSFGNLLRVVPEAQRALFRADLAAAFDKLKTPDGVVLDDYGMRFFATRPQIR